MVEDRCQFWSSEKTRNDVQQMKSMIGDISDKLDTVMAQRESEDEGQF